MLVLGAALTACEGWGVWEYMAFKNAPLYLAVFGIAVAICAPCLALVKGPVRWWAGIVAPIAMAAVLLTGMARMGSVADVAVQAREKADRHHELAEKTMRDLETTLAEAREAVALACAKSVTKKCTDAQAARDAAQKAVTTARAAVINVPVVAGDPVAQAVSELLGGLVSPARLQTVLPLLIPVSGALMAWVFFAAWRSWPVEAETVKTADKVSTVHNAAVTQEPVAAPASTTYRAAEALGRLRVTGGRARVDLARVREFYVDECKRRQAKPASGEAFTDDVAAWCAANNVELHGDGSKVFMLGVRLPQMSGCA
jgi:hypothetical protein